MSDFYEDDEPVEDVTARFDRGPWGITGWQTPPATWAAPARIRLVNPPAAGNWKPLVWPAEGST